MSDYYIDGLIGNDANAGTSEGAGNAWKTIGKAISNPIAAGDRVFVKASAIYSENPNFTSISGTMAAPVVLEGYGSVVGDGVRASIVGNGGTRWVLVTGPKYSVRNFKVSGGSSVANSAGIHVDDLSVVDNCEADGESVIKNGFFGEADTYHVGCYAYDCTVRGFYYFGLGGAFACIAENSVTGIKNNVRTFGFFYCIARGNSSAGLAMASTSQGELIVNCTVDGLSGTKGITQGSSGALAAVINCVVINCISGMEIGGTSPNRNWSFNNCVFGNTDDYGGGSSTASGEITSDPDFVDEAAKNYGPDAGSPLIMAGYDSRIASWLTMTGDPIDVGALQSAAGGDNFAGAFLNWGVN